MEDKVYISFKLIFKVRKETTYGENLFVVGNKTCLGLWEPKNALPLYTNPNIYPLWESNIINVENFEIFKNVLTDVIEYKYIIKNDIKENNNNNRDMVQWESTYNRYLDLTPKVSDNNKTFEVNDDYFNNPKTKYLLELKPPKSKVSKLIMLNPFRKLKYNILKYLLDFVEVESRFKLKFVNMKFFKAIPVVLKTIYIKKESTSQIEKESVTWGYSYNKPNISITIPKNLFKPLTLSVTVNEKDLNEMVQADIGLWLELHYQDYNSIRVTIGKNNKVDLRFNFINERSKACDKLKDNIKPETILWLTGYSYNFGFQTGNRCLDYLYRTCIEFKCLIIENDY